MQHSIKLTSLVQKAFKWLFDFRYFLKFPHARLAALIIQLRFICIFILPHAAAF